ncbi:hypothetical protein DMENIID0001_060180 [Sergentomyia squamirostris]
MKLAAVICLCGLAVLMMAVDQTEASPVLKPYQPATNARQAAPAAPTASVDDDDDDDDEEDELEDALDDDDDDDDDDDTPAGASDDDDDDEDDEDYFERFFDDILGEDDDDDDDDISPATGIQQPIAPAEIQQPVDLESPVLYDEDEAAAEGVDIIAPSADTIEGGVKDPAETISPVVTNAVAVEEDDDDDDDEEEDLEDALDDDDDEDDDDDDEDDIIIDARGSKARELKTRPVEKRPNAAKKNVPKKIKKNKTVVAQIKDGTETLSKETVQLNSLFDGVFRRFNTLLKKNYDPVKVRLSTLTELTRRQTTKKGTKKNKPKTKKRTTKKRNNEVKADSKPAPAKAKATLHGLATLERVGNARSTLKQFDGETNATMVKTKFHLGPLRLKVEKIYGRGTKRELRSATATTAQMNGQISLKVVNETATLHSIRVQQPRQVMLEGANGAKCVGKKCDSNLAHIATTQLRKAARALLQNILVIGS